MVETTVNTAKPDATRQPDLLAGLLTRREVAAQFRRTERTIIRFERAGMPFIALGMTRLYDPVRVREWLMSHERRHDAPRRGRPAKKVAA